MLRAAKLTAFAATVMPARARAFYEDVLGLRLLTEDRFALAFDVDGVQLRVQKVEEFRPQPFTVLGWEVPSIRDAMAELSLAGVVFERYAFLEQDATGVWTAPGGTQVAWFKDPDGNLLSLAEGRGA